MAPRSRSARKLKWDGTTNTNDLLMGEEGRWAGEREPRYVVHALREVRRLERRPVVLAREESFDLAQLLSLTATAHTHRRDDLVDTRWDRAAPQRAEHA